MAGMRCYAFLFFETPHLAFHWKFQKGSVVGLWQRILPYRSYKGIQIEMFEFEIEYDFVHSRTKALDRICYFITPLLKTPVQI